MKKKKKTLVVIPTYNEKDNLKSILPAILKQVPGIHILVVDDSSPDGTGELVDQLAKKSKGRIHALHRPGKMGLGPAYIAGFTWALEKGYDYIAQMDADWSHDPKYLSDFLEKIEESDLVVGSRYLEGRVSVVNWPLSRLVLSAGASLYVRLITGLPLSDCTGGMKCFRAEVLRQIDMTKVRSDGYSFQIEMNYKAFKKGFRIKQIPIIFIDRTSGSSKMSGRIIREAIWRVWAIRLGL